MGAWWLVGIGMWAVILAVITFGKGNPDGCPRCGHDAGLDGKHCAEHDDYNGWSSEQCRCDNDYHWNYESVTLLDSP